MPIIIDLSLVINYSISTIKFVLTSKIAQHSDVIDLTIFKNGIILGSTGFRSYSTMSVIRFINEIFNGYLPTELTTQYPDGVVIVVCPSVVHFNTTKH